MKNSLTLFLSLVMFLSSAWLQGQNHPSKVVKASYFDKTLPLREKRMVPPRFRDRTWKDHLIKNPSMEAFIDRSDPAKQPVTDLETLQREAGSKAVRGPLVNIDGVNNVNGVFPPDTEGDVGLNHYFQMINLSFAIYDKNGIKLYGPADNSTLWDGFVGSWTGTNDGDPIVLYDHLADRWLASQFAVNTTDGTYWELIAVSETPDPLGAWYRYAFEFDDFNDYPKIGVWPDGYYITYNMFSNGVYQGAAVTVLDRDAMLSGDPDAQMVFFGPYGAKYSIQPADLDGPEPPAGAPNYVAAMNFNTNHQLEIWEVATDWDTPSSSTFTLAHNLTPASYNSILNNVPQPNTNQKLDDLSNFLMYKLQYRNFGDHQSMVLNHTVNVGGIAGVRWYELRNQGTAWSIYQQGTYAPDTDYRWMGSIAMNGRGDIALGYSVSSTSTFPSVRYTGRLAGDPLGQMTVNEIELVAGLGSQTNVSRWGDYSTMSVDPVGDTTFWYTQEYRRASGWGTRIGSFDFNPTVPPLAFAGADTTICETQALKLNGGATSAASVLWTTSGDGNFFPNATLYDPTYVRGSEDVVNGGVSLYLTATGYEAGQTAVDSMAVTIVREPLAQAGNDTLICDDQSLSLSGVAQDYSSTEWSTTGDGVFSDPDSLNAVYTPGAGDIAAGEVELSLTANAMAPCLDPDTDKLILSIDPCPGVVESEPHQGWKLTPNPARDQVVLTGAAAAGPITITIRTLQGDQMIRETISQHEGSVNWVLQLKAFSPGLYLWEVEHARGTAKLKLIVE